MLIILLLGVILTTDTDAPIKKNIETKEETQIYKLPKASKGIILYIEPCGNNIYVYYVKKAIFLQINSSSIKLESIIPIQ